MRPDDGSALDVEGEPVERDDSAKAHGQVAHAQQGPFAFARRDDLLHGLKL
jgi:hypothetical protein